MNENGKVPGVYAKIAKVMQAVQTVPKNGRNNHFKYDYVTEADLVHEIRPLMAELGLVMIPSQTEQREQVGDVTRIHHVFRFIDAADGSSVEFGVWGEGQDKADKGSYKAFTGAMKYALMKAFMVATGDDPEQDTGGDAAKPAKKKAPEPEGPPKATATQIQQIKNLYLPLSAGLSEPEKKACKEALTGESAERAEAAIKFLTERAGEQVGAA